MISEIFLTAICELMVGGIWIGVIHSIELNQGYYRVKYFGAIGTAILVAVQEINSRGLNAGICLGTLLIVPLFYWRYYVCIRVSR